MGRNRRMEYKLIGMLYEHNHSTVVIGELLQTPNGHISKVLKKEGIQARGRGVVVLPFPMEDWNPELQLMLLSDADLFARYRKIMGYTDDVMKAVQMVPVEDVVEDEQKEWKDMTLDEKGEEITRLLDMGLSTRKVASILGVSQSTVVKTNNRYKYGTDTKPKQLV